ERVLGSTYHTSVDPAAKYSCSFRSVSFRVFPGEMTSMARSGERSEIDFIQLRRSGTFFQETKQTSGRRTSPLARRNGPSAPLRMPGSCSLRYGVIRRMIQVATTDS